MGKLCPKISSKLAKSLINILMEFFRRLNALSWWKAGSRSYLSIHAKNVNFQPNNQNKQVLVKDSQENQNNANPYTKNKTFKTF